MASVPDPAGEFYAPCSAFPKAISCAKEGVSLADQCAGPSSLLSLHTTWLADGVSACRKLVMSSCVVCMLMLFFLVAVVYLNEMSSE